MPNPSAVGAAAALLSAASALAGLPQFTLTDLGPSSSTDRAVINNNGLVSFNGPNGPVTWQNGATVTLPLSPFAGVLGINSAGSLAGHNGGSPMTYVNGVVSTIPGVSLGYARRINDSGQVITQRNSNAYITSGGVTTQLNAAVGGRTVYVEDLNNGGVAVGTAADVNSNYHAFVWSNGVLTGLNLPGSLGQTRATGISNKGSIVGGGNSPWFRSAGGVVTTLGSVPNDNLLVPLALNESDQVIGFYRQIGGGFRAVIWDGTTAVPLTPFVSAPGWTLELATDINDHGTIVGFGKLNGLDRAFMLTPVPSPGACVIVGAGALVVGRRRRRPA